MENLTGQKIFRLRVIQKTKFSVSTGVLWKCRCDCGKIKNVSHGHLRNARDGKPGAVKSCGCLGKERKKTGNLKHGFRFTKEYHVWLSMRERCNNPRCKSYKYYGARGVKVHPRWNKFVAFIEDMGWRPKSLDGARFSVDRIDNDKGYEPSNCRWATASQQSRNTRRNIFVTVDGKEMLLIEWAEKNEFLYRRVYYALKTRNGNFDRLLSDWKEKGWLK